MASRPSQPTVPQWSPAGDGVWQLTDRPGAFWLLCAVVMGIGGLGLTAGALAIRDAGGDAAIATLICAFAVAGGIVGVAQSPLTRVRVDIRARVLGVTRVGLGIRRIRIPFENIRDVVIATDRDVDGDHVVRPVLVLRDASRLPVSLLWQRDRPAVEALAAALRGWIGP